MDYYQPLSVQADIEKTRTFLGDAISEIEETIHLLRGLQGESGTTLRGTLTKLVTDMEQSRSELRTMSNCIALTKNNF
jgi:hypothetical protein